MRILDFADGFQSSSAPSSVSLPASAVSVTPSGNLGSSTAQTALQELQGDIDTINAKVGAANGIATLDATGHIPSAQIPAIAIISVYSVANIAARDALTVQSGDVALVTDIGGGVSQSYMYDGTTWKVLKTDASLASHAATTTGIHGVTGNIVGTTDTQTLTNKTLTAPVINSPTGITKADVGLSNVDNTSDATKNSATAVLTNKDIDGGTASNTSRITLPKAAKTVLDGLTRKAGTIVFDTTSGKPYYDDGTALQLVGSGSGGGSKNYITGGDAEAGVIGTGYADGSAVPLATVTGSPTATLTTTTTLPLSSATSFVYTPGALGNGRAFPFSIDREDMAKVLEVELSYELGGTGYTDGDLQLWVIAPSGAVLQTSNYKIPKVGIQYKLKTTFQSEASGSQYYLKLHQTTATSTYTMKFELKCGPQTVTTGSLRGPVGSIIATGSTTPPTGYLYADGSAISRTLYAKLFTAIGTTFGTGDGSTTFNLPNLKGVFLRGSGSQTIGGITYTGTLGSSQGDQMQGHIHQTPSWDATLSGSNNSKFPSGGLNAVGQTSTGGPVTDGTNGTPRTGSETRPANVTVAYHICYDEGSVALSSDTSGRLISAQARLITASQNFTANVITRVAFNAINEDTVGGFSNSGATYTVKESGTFEFQPTLSFNPCATAGTNLFVYLYKNGSAIKSIAGNCSATLNNCYTPTFKDETAKAGDYYEIYAQCGQGISLFSDASIYGGSTWSIKKLAGNQQIAASESYYLDAVDASSLVVATGSTGILIPYATSVRYTHGTLVSGVFTASAPGEFEVHAAFLYPPNSTGYRALKVLKNGSDYRYLDINYTPSASQNCFVCGTTPVYLLAGETIKIYAEQSSGGNLTSPGGNSTNYMFIKRVGN